MVKSKTVFLLAMWFVGKIVQGMFFGIAFVLLVIVLAELVASGCTGLIHN